MAGEPLEPRLARFGSFEVDLVARELRKRGVRLKLQEQPFQILALLLEHPGEIVSRDAIYEKVWSSKETFVEFEHSLNASVARLRQTLNDSAGSPRFIETIPRRGYRFIAPVEIVGAKSEPAAAPPVPTPAYEPEIKAPRSWHPWRIAAGVLIVALASAVLWLAFRGAPATPVLRRITSHPGLTTHPALSRDGKLLAYASDRTAEAGLDLWVQQLSSSAVPIRLTSNSADEHQPVFSPDGSKIAYRSEQDGGGIYVIPALGGTPVLLAPGGRDPQWSPDGSVVAYWTGRPLRSAFGAAAAEASLFLVPAGGGPAAPLKTDLRFAGQPVWAPDGKHLIVYGYSGEIGADLPMGASVQAADWWVLSASGGPAVRTGALAKLESQGLIPPFPFDVPRPAVWMEDTILFSARLHESTNLWRIPIRRGTWRVDQPAERLTAGTGVEVNPSIAADGRIAFASVSLYENIWMLPLDANHGRVTGALTRVSNGLWSDSSPSVSVDGKLLVYDSTRSGQAKQEIWLKDFQTGREVALASPSVAARHPEISRDGSRVGYSTDSGTYVVPAGGGQPEELCGKECGFIWDWSPDGGSVLLSRRSASFNQLDLFNLATRRLQPFMKSARRVLFQSKLSPDGRWLSFFATEGSGVSVYIAPVVDGASPDENLWVRVGERGEWIDKPRWSPDGNLLYVMSERDGNRCLWAHRLDPLTKRPLNSQPLGIYHPHAARLSMSNVAVANLEIAVAKDKIVFNLGELTGNVWTLTR